MIDHGRRSPDTAGMQANTTFANTASFSDMPRVIGLIGGMSWESSALYYQQINQEVRRRLGPLRSARLLMYSVDFGAIEHAQREGRWDDAAAILADAAQRLHRGGADGLVLCTNTMHKVAAAITQAVPIPLLHIADPVGRAAQAMGATTIGLLGTRFTMEQPFLRERLAQQWGLQVLTPDAEDRSEVHRIIYEELCAGVIATSSRQRYQAIIQDLAARGAQAVVLGCTEITLLIQAADSALPVLDTTRLHALAAVDFALGSSAAMPECSPC
jgi:aspartate racemase